MYFSSVLTAVPVLPCVFAPRGVLNAVLSTYTAAADSYECVQLYFANLSSA